MVEIEILNETGTTIGVGTVKESRQKDSCNYPTVFHERVKRIKVEQGSYLVAGLGRGHSKNIIGKVDYPGQTFIVQ